VLGTLENVLHCMIQVDLVLVSEAPRRDIIFQEWIQECRAPVAGVLLPGKFQDRHWRAGKKEVFICLI
jgi:hypothetical protein